MLQSQIFTKIKKETPKDEKSINAILLQRAGFVQKEMAGVYSFLPLGLRVLRNIIKIIQEEMNKIGGQEVLLTVLQPKILWQKTNRWDEGIGKEVMYKCEDGEMGLGPTHEEMLTDIIKNNVQTKNDLPLYIYQIQTKFRKEARVKSGLLRGREFLMKDLYSFHSSEKDFHDYYEKVKQAYLTIFQRCGISAIITEASGGGFSKEFSHEFQALCPAGEDNIFYCSVGHFSRNKEIFDSLLKKCPICSEELLEGRSIELGNIFSLGTKYSQDLGALFLDDDGHRKPILMGCYGIGVSRLMGSIVEIYNDEKGILWPKGIAPFVIHLIALFGKGEKENQEVATVAGKMYQDLQKIGIEVLYDDRQQKTAGEKFAEADLIGIPLRIVISSKTVAQQSFETKERKSREPQILPLADLTKFIKDYVNSKQSSKKF